MHIKNERLIRKAVKGIKSTTLFARILLMLLLALLIFKPRIPEAGGQGVYGDHT